jgi:hypothetical protein
VVEQTVKSRIDFQIAGHLFILPPVLQMYKKDKRNTTKTKTWGEKNEKKITFFCF